MKKKTQNRNNRKKKEFSVVSSQARQRKPEYANFRRSSRHRTVTANDKWNKENATEMYGMNKTIFASSRIGYVIKRGAIP